LLFQLIIVVECRLARTRHQPWLPLINGLVDDALIELSPDKKLTAASDPRRYEAAVNFCLGNFVFVVLCG